MWLGHLQIEHYGICFYWWSHVICSHEFSLYVNSSCGILVARVACIKISHLSMVKSGAFDFHNIFFSLWKIVEDTFSYCCPWQWVQFFYPIFLEEVYFPEISLSTLLLVLAFYLNSVSKDTDTFPGRMLNNDPLKCSQCYIGLISSGLSLGQLVQYCLGYEFSSFSERVISLSFKSDCMFFIFFFLIFIQDYCVWRYNRRGSLLV